MTDQRSEVEGDSSSSIQEYEMSIHQDSGRNYDRVKNETRRKESLCRREAELSKVTGEAVKQMEKLITVTQTMHEFEDLNARLQEDNGYLQMHTSSLEADLVDKDEEINDLKLYIRELHKELVTSRENAAQFRSETDRLKIDKLVRRGGVILGMSTTPDELDEEFEGTDEHGGRLKHRNKNGQPERRNMDTNRNTFTGSERHKSTVGDNCDGTSTLLTEESDGQLDYELRQVKRQIKSLMRQMSENETFTKSLKRENEVLRQKLAVIGRGVDSDSCDSRSKHELLRVIRFSIEDKVRWQAYAERLIRRVLRLSPNVLDVAHFKPLRDNGQGDFPDSMEPRWESFALSLVQKVMEVDPHLLENFSKPNKKDHEKGDVVGFV